jgi:hypothetical protein
MGQIEPLADWHRLIGALRRGRASRAKGDSYGLLYQPEDGRFAVAALAISRTPPRRGLDAIYTSCAIRNGIKYLAERHILTPAQRSF